MQLTPAVVFTDRCEAQFDEAVVRVTRDNKKGGRASGRGAREVVVESLSPEVFRRRVDVALRDMRG